MEGRLAYNQVLYHLQQRSIEHAVLPWCEMHRVAVTGYSPFGHGRFPASHTESGRVLAKIAETRDATPRQVALAFLSRRQSLFTIPKASTPAHAEENAGAGDLNLSESEIALIDAAFPRGPPAGQIARAVGLAPHSGLLSRRRFGGLEKTHGLPIF
jgi:diketogulonate reductase-like aldo/keto reductase